KKRSSRVAKPAPPSKGGKKGEDLPADISRIDMRVGKVVEVERHPDADSLYVERVDLGEGSLRTVVSGLAPHVPVEKMQGLVGIFVCNLKPVKMCGIESQG
ncbi:Aminoacyl tRNA synthase complex-interacting multifunctional protein 1, partial [Taenia solium]